VPSTAPEVIGAFPGVAIWLLEAASTVTILGGAGLAIAALARRRSITEARHMLSNAILLALDFAIGADIVKMAANPELATVLVVGGVVGIGIALTLVIVWELRRAPPARRTGGAVSRPQVAMAATLAPVTTRSIRDKASRIFSWEFA
jgi:uncharacterized membrane protein